MVTNFLRSLTGLGRTKMVLVVRTDLNMSPGKIAVQCAHAAVMLYEASLKSNRTFLNSWWYSGQPKIVLKVDKNGEEVLKTLYETAKSRNLKACLVCDAGKTEVSSGTITVLGLGPNKSNEIDKITKHLKLL